MIPFTYFYFIVNVTFFFFIIFEEVRWSRQIFHILFKPKIYFLRSLCRFKRMLLWMCVQRLWTIATLMQTRLSMTGHPAFRKRKSKSRQLDSNPGSFYLRNQGTNPELISTLFFVLNLHRVNKCVQLLLESFFSALPAFILERSLTVEI